MTNMEPIVTDDTSLKIRGKFTMAFPSMMDESYEEDKKVFSYPSHRRNFVKCLLILLS